MPSYDSLFFLRFVIAMPRLLYTLRTAPCSGNPELCLYDNLIRETISTTLNIDLNENRWNQASLPVRWGGLGIRSAVMLAPSAYLASAAGTLDLTTRILPDRLRDSEDSYVKSAMDAWSISSGGSDHTTIVPSSQRSWDDVCCRSVSDDLLNNSTNDSDRARLLASRSDSGDWLNAVPLQAVGLKLDNEAVRIAIGLRLGAPLVHPHTCVCGVAVSADAHHGLACRKSAGRHSRHNHINDILQRAFNSAGVLSTREPLGLCTQGKRPDGITSVPWHKGRCLAWDATCPDTFAQSHVQSSSVSAGAAAAAAELKKRNKYSDLPPHIDFTPVAIETSGVWGEDARDLIKELGRRIALVQLEPRSTSFLRQRISLAIQRGNSFCIQATHPQFIETSNLK